MATRLLRMNGDHEPLGQLWVSHFITRNPRVASIVGRTIESARTSAANYETIKAFLELFERTRVELGIQYEDMWNMDETGVALGVTLNNKVLSRDTEPDLVLAPRFYWSLFLRDKLEKLLQKKLPPSKRVACEETNVVVSVTERSQRDLTKRFDEMDIDWCLVERQLAQWGESFRAGKKLRLDVTFNYLKALIRHVAQGGQLQSHDDVPEDVRQQLYAEEQQQLERHQRTSHRAPAGHPPIHITNVLPGSSHSIPGPAEMQTKPRLDVPGFLDAAVEEYSDWQQSRVMREDQKDDIRNMCDMALEHGLDLQQLHDDQDPDFFISRGIKLGVARRFIRDIGYWVQQRITADGGIITIE
ncbi:hypothetical protein E8E11_001061 [Didymella keratinophila]|nr:hypothetical protein E8E11_001061 [Didymella keratinophila]